MNEQERIDMQDWEDDINALLDGELSPESAEALKAAAGEDQRLAQAIIQAYQLQQALASIPVERAPASLRRTLRRIPAEQQRDSRPFYWQPRWAMALAAVPLIWVALHLAGPGEPSAAEIAQAQKDLAIALSYIEKVSNRAGHEIESTVGGEMNDAVTGNVIRTIQHQTDFSKEKQA